ncbi:Protein NUCLEAR FUSION DEFECTIVE [Arachis hypogaea]|uniref:Protein NUCLEAR FUSION DEFECTIVE n=1 Tax=Arachis hypogaea TaxID=3818 RepID=A0A6B9V546_ARAHY|nr:Protein NUCLEAR FUSION DEFECTIVE [Arachis hypogaea]
MMLSGENGGARSKDFAVQVFTGRWFMVFSSFMIMSVSGASYMFSLYSREIKSSLGYDQSTLNLLSFFKDLGSNIGILSGLINEITPPYVVLTIGGVLNFFGYFIVWLAVSKKIAKPQVWTMCLYIFIGANSHCSTNTGALVTSVKNFPGVRGIVIGLLSGYLGLSAAIITQLYYAFYGSDTKSLLLLMAWLPTATAFLFLPFIRHHKGRTQNLEGQKHQQQLNCEDLPNPKPLNIITTEKPKEVTKPAQPSSSGSCWKDMFKAPNRGGNLTVVNNLSQIGTSLGYSPHSITTFVSLMAIWIYLGKIVQGVVSEFVITRFKIPRPFMLTSILLLSCVGHLLIAFNVPNGLYVASIVIGFCFGANWPILFSIISELFGLKYYSTLYNVGSIASPIGSYLLSVRVAGHFYDKEGLRQMAAMGLKRNPNEELNCNGAECYKLAFIVITAVCLFGALVSLILVYRTRELYKGDLYKKFREEDSSTINTAETEMAMSQYKTVVEPAAN